MKRHNEDESAAGVAARASGGSGAALRYVEAYNKWQTLYAYYRLQGWEPKPTRGGEPPELAAAYNAQLAAFEAMHIACTGEGKPNYVERARRRLLEEQQR